jgi:hypothetical protein
MPQTQWGTLSREDTDGTRKTRGLGLGAAVRKFNDLAVPGLGGLWFAKPLLWSLLGIELGGRVRRPNAEVATAIEALACWHALRANGGQRNPRIGGRTKLAALPEGFVPFVRARRRSFYVTVPMRQGMVQPLRALGLVQPGVQRFNAYRLTPDGEDLLTEACAGFRPGHRDVLSALALWIRGDASCHVHSPILRDALSPLTPLPRPAIERLRDRLLTGDGGARRAAVRSWVRDLEPSNTRISWTDRPKAIQVEHWEDLREGARFFLMRDTALRTLDAVEAALRPTASQTLSASEAASAVSKQLADLRASAQRFLSADRDPTHGDASQFATHCAGPDATAVLVGLVRLDGRGLRYQEPVIVPGPAFDRDAATPATPEGNPEPVPELAGLPWPEGVSGRVRAMRSLHDDLEQVSPTQRSAP